MTFRPIWKDGRPLWVNDRPLEDEQCCCPSSGGSGGSGGSSGIVHSSGDNWGGSDGNDWGGGVDSNGWCVAYTTGVILHIPATEEEQLGSFYLPSRGIYVEGVRAFYPPLVCLLNWAPALPSDTWSGQDGDGSAKEPDGAFLINGIWEPAQANDFGSINWGYYDAGSATTNPFDHSNPWFVSINRPFAPDGFVGQIPGKVCPTGNYGGGVIIVGPNV